MLNNEENIRKQYQEHEDEFRKTKDNLYGTLQNIAGIFYQRTKFKVLVSEPRIKTIDSIISKVRRKGVAADALFKKDDDKISLVVNDFLGARILCNTHEDVDEIISLLRQFPRFKLVKEEELNKPSGYRAIHLDILYQGYWKDEHVFIPVEIQIKTHLQNAWANITHDESYKPENDNLKNEWELKYSKHMADMLETLDNMASTIRKQRLNIVKPPLNIGDSDTLINPNTLSYKIDLLKRGKRLTQQEMALVINRLKEERFETLAEAWDLLQDDTIEKSIKEYKEQLRSNENVQPFETLYYGSLLKRRKDGKFQEEMSKDYGFVQHQCLQCNRLLTNDEYEFIKSKTDSDTDFYCNDHRLEHFQNQCPQCGIFTSSELCKNCEAKIKPF